MPDGANAENTGTENEDPGTPADQVNAEITREGVFGWWRSLFGIGDPYEAGGGGTGGQFMFANLDDLNSVITRWEQERDGIQQDCNTIADAYWAIKEPAADPLSGEQAQASRDSLANMWTHSNSMLNYANNYIEKLKASRQQIAVMEQGAQDQIRSVRT